MDSWDVVSETTGAPPAPKPGPWDVVSQAPARAAGSAPPVNGWDVVSGGHEVLPADKAESGSVWNSELGKTISSGLHMAQVAYDDVIENLRKTGPIQSLPKSQTLSSLVTGQSGTPAEQARETMLQAWGPATDKAFGNFEQERAADQAAVNDQAQAPQSTAGKIGAGAIGLFGEAPLFMIGGGPGRAAGEAIVKHLPAAMSKLEKVVPLASEFAGSFAGESAARGQDWKKVGLSAAEGAAMATGGEMGAALATARKMGPGMVGTARLIGQASGLITAQSAEQGKPPTAEDIGQTFGTLMAMTLTHKGVSAAFRKLGARVNAEPAPAANASASPADQMEEIRPSGKKAEGSSLLKNVEVRAVGAQPDESRPSPEDLGYGTSGEGLKKAMADRLPDETPVVTGNVPYAGGVKADNSAVVEDPHIPETEEHEGKVYPVREMIAFHERVEKPLMDKGVPYPQAHEVATAAENALWKARGFDPEVAQQVMKPFIHRARRAPAGPPTPGLDPTPYVDMGEQHLVEPRSAIEGLNRPSAETSGLKAGVDLGGDAITPAPPVEESGATKAAIDAAAHQAATSPHNGLPEPTDAQKAAGNYKVGKIAINGLHISIENPKGSIRSGVDRSGRAWSQTLQDHYGYITGAPKGKDGDHVDVFLGDHPEDASRPVFVIDQVDPATRRLDEHKVVLGAADEAQARQTYLRNYEQGWNGLGGIKEMSLDGFKTWLKAGGMTKRVAEPDRQRALKAKMKAGAPKVNASPDVTPALLDQPAEEPRFSRMPVSSVGKGPGIGMSVEAARSIVARAVKSQRLVGNLKFAVHAGEDALPAPLQRQIEEANAQGSVRAAYEPKTKTVHLIAPQFADAAEIEEAILHEALGHYGARRLFGTTFSRAMSDFYDQLGGRQGVEAVAKRYGINMKSYLDDADLALARGDADRERAAIMLADELLAHLQGKRASESLPEAVVRAIRELIGAIRQALGKRGFIELAKFSDHDLAYLLRRMARAAQQPSGIEIANEPRFSRRQEQAAQAPQPESPRSVISKAAQLVGKIIDASDILKDIQFKIAPIAAGNREFAAYAKDFANRERRASWEWNRIDDILKKDFTAEQRDAMGRALDEQSVAEQLGRDTTGIGLDRLNEDERSVIGQLQAYGEALWQRALDIGMVKGEGLPSYMPRLIVNLDEGGTFTRVGKSASPQDVHQLGRNLTTTSANLKRRQYLTPEETEAAAKAKFGEGATLVRDIRALPLALARFERAIAGRELVQSIKEFGKQIGVDTVSEGEKPGFVSINHPALKQYRPRFTTDDEGKTVVATDSDGNPIFDKTDLYIRKDLIGPLKAVLSSSSGRLYKLFMALKGKTMSLIMYSPIIHNAVEWGRALPVMPGKVATGMIYFQGFRAKHDAELMRHAIDVGGLSPIGRWAFMQDITDTMNEADLKPGRIWTAKTIGGAVGLASGKAGEAVKRGVDAAGNFWHNTLLWDRIADLQAGIYVNMRQRNLARGMDDPTATRVAAHFANRFAGALPRESMSQAARAVANVFFFSRTFTLGNMAAMKDAVRGMPPEVQAQILRDSGKVQLKLANSVTRKKAAVSIAIDVGFDLATVALIQNIFQFLNGEDWDHIGREYLGRWNAWLAKTKQNPLEVLNVKALLPQSHNEPGKENRSFIGRDQDGTAIYLRNPTGKIGEEFINYGTQPLQQIENKEGTITRPIIQTLANDRGFGRRVYNPDDPLYKEIGAVMLNFVSQQIPMDALRSARSAILTGNRTDTLKALGPLFGITFSKGAPGGPDIGEMWHVEQQRQALIAETMPKVNEQIREGDIGGAIDTMAAIGMTPGEIKAHLNYAEVPEARLPKGLKRFSKTASPEDLQRMQDLMHQ